MKRLLESLNKFAGEPEQKLGDQVRGTDVAKKSGKGKKHPFLHQLVGDSKKNEFKNKLIKEFNEFKDGEAGNPTDAVKLDVPLLIRLLEYAREDAKQDMDLHKVAEQLVKLSSQGRTLGMQDYDLAVSQAQEPMVKEDPVPNPNNQVPMTPQEMQKANQEKLNLQKNLGQLKSAGIDIDPTKMSQTLNKADNNQMLAPADKDNVAKMAPAINNIVSNPQLAGQFKALIQKAGQGQ